MKIWKRWCAQLREEGRITDAHIYEEACRVAGVGGGDHFKRWLNKRGPAYRKRTTARRRLTQAHRRLVGDLPPLAPGTTTEEAS